MKEMKHESSFQLEYLKPQDRISVLLIGAGFLTFGCLFIGIIIRNLYMLRIGGILLGGWFFLIGIYWLLRKRIIENIPTSKIRSLSMGLTEIYGEVLPLNEKTLVCPMSGKRCVYYFYQKIKSRRRGNLGMGTMRIPFIIRDSTGVVIVNPEGAHFDIKKDETITKGGDTFDEYRIDIGDNIHILGSAIDNPDVNETTGKKNTDDIIIGQGKTQKLFYISDNRQKHILKTIRKRFIVFSLAGPLILILSLYSILI